MEPMLIGIAGKARSGKDSVGWYFKERYKFQTYAFADPLKKAASEMFGVPLSSFYDGILKEIVIEEWGFSPRQMIQRLGTEGGRQLFRKDIWTKRAEIEWNNVQRITIDNCRGLVVTDIRFENEAEMIRKNGGLVIHIQRDDAQKINSHESENGVEFNPSDVIISNNDTIHDLYRRVDDFMMMIEKGEINV